MKILIDSNILVYSLYENSEHFAKSREILKKNSDLFISTQNLIETFRVITSAQFQTQTPYEPKDAVDTLDIFSQNMKVVSPNKETFIILKGLIAKYGVKSYAIYDANIVATMITYGIDCIYTNNQNDFKKYKEISAINPIE